MPVKCEFITGEAGTGKSFLVQEAVREDPAYGILSAPTGVAAVNVGSITINSLLKYGRDVETMQDCYMTGRLTARVVELSKLAKRLVIDEAPMFSGRALDILYRAIQEANARDNAKPLGLTLIGDFAQLPPIKEPWLFQADCWKEFAQNTTRLTKNWRQSSDWFISALNAIRVGDARHGADLFREGGVLFHDAGLPNFDGTTILARNADVDRHNYLCYSALKRGREIIVRSTRWGDQRGEWSPERGLVPLESRFKIGAYVMILANDAPRFNYVNGDCGYVRDYNDITGKFTIELIRTGKIVEIGFIERYHTVKDKPSSLPSRVAHAFCACFGADRASINLSLNDPGAASGTTPQRGYYPTWGAPSYNCSPDTWNTGAVRYYPLRLAYAATVWKTQGLTLDRIQVDYRNYFFSSPAALYVALSRCRTPEGLRLVGSEERFIKRVNVAKEAQPWF